MGRRLMAGMALLGVLFVSAPVVRAEGEVAPVQGQPVGIIPESMTLAEAMSPDPAVAHVAQAAAVGNAVAAAQSAAMAQPMPSQTPPPGSSEIIPLTDEEIEEFEDLFGDPWPEEMEGAGEIIWPEEIIPLTDELIDGLSGE